MAEDLAASIQKHCWDARDQFFYTADVQCVDRQAELIPNVKRGMDALERASTAGAGVYGLPAALVWDRVAAQAKALVAANYAADERFRAEAGVRSLSSLESMYALDFSSNPSNWLGPGWIVVNYLVWAGLKPYGFAAELADKTIRLLASAWRRTAI